MKKQQVLVIIFQIQSIYSNISYEKARYLCFQRGSKGDVKTAARKGKTPDKVRTSTQYDRYYTL